MYHSVTFTRLPLPAVGDPVVKNTWTDWKLIPTGPPMFSPPPVNEQTVAIPGAHGLIDLTDLLTGTPTYANTSGQWTFIVSN